ncbi:MAG: GNAT family N-acetyltransferase [Acutalibacter sp.]|jgi:GNAT superfamily N-acetyltransferase
MELKMRKAQEADLDGLDQVMLVISDAAGDRETVKKLLKKIDADPQKYLLVAEDVETGTICGSLFGVVFEDICDTCRPILLVENVAVLESYQGKGVGRAMFQEIERWGKEEWDCHYEILVSGMNRTGAHKFYQALGFIEAKGFKKYL